MRLGEIIGRWLGRVEIVLSGAEEDLRAGEDALAVGEPMKARSAAHRVLARAPESPLGLALLADACEMAGLDAELAMTLEDLARRAASRAEVWVRLGRARRATQAPLEDVRDAFIRALAVAESGSESRREALLELCDLDLAQGDGPRAELWLERAANDKAPEVALRRAEARLLQGDPAGARRWLEGNQAPPTDTRAAVSLGRALAMLEDAAAFAPLLRAMVLDAPGASELLSSALAWIPSDEATRARVQTVVEAKGESDLARWRAAFARAAGDRDRARSALREAALSGDVSAARPLLDSALDDRDESALDVALSALPPNEQLSHAAADARRLPLPAATIDAERAESAFDAITPITSLRVIPWAEAMARTTATALVPTAEPAAWPKLLARLDRHARGLADLEAIASLAEIAAMRARPVRVAIVGEFNAGKSTFINALIGEEVAPTGVLPTTATLHHLRYAPDPIARILFTLGHEPPERIVPIGELRAILKTIDTEAVRRVEIQLPIPSLTRVEILDTPGFNAPDKRHTDAARAAFEEADAAIWLLDAAQPLKQTERVVLDEAKAARIPVQMLVNKADRLGPDDLAQVMAAVDESLGEAGLASWTRPLALSARKALAGRLGDQAALESSGWPAVQSLLDEQIVGRSEELKERALRRRAAQVVTRLVARAARVADDEREQATRETARAQAVAHAAAAIDRDADDSAENLAASLETQAEAWKRDLELLVTGRDPDAIAKDRALARYRIDRAVARLAPALSNGLAALARGAEMTPEALLPMARTLVRASAAGNDRKASSAILLPLSRAAVATLVEHLFAAGVAPPPPARATGLLRELGAILEALLREKIASA